jgi:DNA-binding transcriptional MerR regulator
MYTVKQLSDFAGISVRTLHYYDEIALLNPSFVGDNSYRYYADEAVFRLQQILFFRELGFSLTEIKTILDEPEFDTLAALHAHRDALRQKVRRLNDLIQTVDRTILHLAEGISMSESQLFSGFDEERYRKEARELYDPQEVDASYKRWNSYTPTQKDQIKAEGAAIYDELVTVMGHGAASPEVQQVIGRWHQHLRYFYEPSVERLRGLGQLYVESPDFSGKFRQLHPNLPEFMREAITVYCAGLESSA